MRTDSTRISDSAKAEATNFINEKYGKDYIIGEQKQAKNLPMLKMPMKQSVQLV